MARVRLSRILLIPLLFVLLPACPDGDGDAGGSADTGGATSGGGTASEGSSGTGSLTQADTASDGGAESGSTDGTCGGAVCRDDESCVDDVCTPNGPPATCDAPVTLSDPQCEDCVARTCCGELESCFGDGTSDADTPCAALLACIHQNCLEIENDEQFNACLDEQCSETVGELEALAAASECVASCLVVSPGLRETCELLPE